MTIREKVINEVAKVPDEKLDDVYEFIHRFRLGLEANRSAPDIMRFAGAWKDMPEAEFEDFLDEMQMRRRFSNTRLERQYHEPS
ncbi:hypothetical protein BH24DEI2_BH24DEI2_29010 [soil metagenome]